MPIFMMFGKYSSQALEGISSDRTDKAVELIEKNGGKVVSMYAVMGEHDLVFTLDFPDAEKAFAASVSRENIMECEKIGIPLQEFVEISLGAMKEIGEEIGL